MPIQNYIRPMSEIYQNLEVTLQATGGHMSACVIAPQFDLYRYGHEELPAYKFTTAETKLPYEFAQDMEFDYELDYNSVSVYAEGLQATIAEWTGEEITTDPSNLLALRCKTGNFASTMGVLDSKLKRYGVQIGDVFVITSNGKTRTCKVMDIIGKVVPASVETAVTAKDEEGITITASGTYEGAKDTTYIITVTGTSEGKVTAWLSDTAGIDYAQEIDITEGESQTIGIMGISASVTGIDKLVEGDVLSIMCFAETASEKDFDGVLLDTMPVTAGATITNVELRKEYSGLISTGNGIRPPYSVEKDGVVIKEQLSIWLEDNAEFIPFVDEVGSLFVSFRVNLISANEDDDKVYIGSIEDIQKNFGTIAYENDIAMACMAALEGAAGRAIYAIRTTGLTEEHFLAAARKTEADTSLYNFVVVTDDVDIISSVTKYNETLCTPELKRWRRTIGGIENPGEYPVASKDVNGKMLRATFNSLDGDTNSTNNNLLQLSDDNEFDFKNISFHGQVSSLHVGDKILLGTNGQKYVVRRVLSARELLLDKGPTTQLDTAQPITVYRADTATNATAFIQGICMNIGNRRGTLVWCDNAVDSTGHVVPNRYLAAYVAGLSSSVVPQQSITRSEVTFVSNASNMYIKYSQHDLDEIARYGCLVLTQDTKGTSVYVRHQLTTETDKGILYYEESCTRNADNIAFAVGDVIEKYVGRANVTKSALMMLDSECHDVLYSFTQNSTDPLIGPSLEYFENLVVIQDPVYKDAVRISYDLYIPAPMNNIRVYHNVHVATVTL